MSIDLSQFHQVFYEESYEGLDVMESSLLDLDPASIDSETINAIFRAAHSIKGGSATFGFTSIAEFTHDLETILDQVRAGQREFRGEDINLCLKSVDCMREMLQLLQAGEDGFTPLSEDIKKQFSRLLANESELEVVTGQDDTSIAPAGPVTWQIIFEPDAGILKTGNDIVRMFRELFELGQVLENQCQFAFDGFSAMDPENCYLSWKILLASERSKTELEEVFEWVADESRLEITTVFDHQPVSDSGLWKIRFKPGPEMLRTGNEPIRLFRALEELGKLEVAVSTQTLPTLALMDHEQCYLAWDLTLVSASATESAILEVFEWVADEAELSITSAAPTESPPLDPSDVGGASVVSMEERRTQVREPNQDEPKTAAPAARPAADASQPGPVSQTNQAKKGPPETGSIRVGIDKVDNLINMVGELVITQSMLGQLGTDFDVNRLPKLMEGLSQLEQNTRELQESVMRIRMLPISFAFSRFPRMVRDLGQSLGKDLLLEMHGEQTELDKTVMEKIGDPLVHLVRNAVDHGIETPAERTARGKPRHGTITLNAYHQGGNVVIEIADDGKGLDKHRIVEKALEKNLISPAEAEYLSDEQAYDLIFQPGFSTASAVSDLSGRGVGMDVVKRNIQALNGVVEIQSEKDQGSKITIRLPLTLAILDGQLVRVGNNTYIFPLVSIVESLQCKKEFISRVAGGCSVFRLRDDYVPIIELYKTFGIQPDTTDLDQSLMVVVEFDGDKVGIVVDELLAQQQVVIKSLEQNYKRVDGISGATILGDGTVALILDIGGIVKLAGEKFGVAHQVALTRKHDLRVVNTKMAG